MTAAKEAPRAETELLKSEMDQLQKDLKNFADREESLTKQVNELTTEKEEAKNQENEHMQSLEEEISILTKIFNFVAIMEELKFSWPWPICIVLQN